MYRMLLLSFSFIFLTRPVPEEKIQFTPIEEVFPVIWKAPVGKVNFRENMLLTPHEIMIGSNGERYMDYTLSDRKGGVYAINRKNGKINRHFGNEVMGDMDVNGLLNYKNKLYYSNDNEEIVCAGLDGKLIWSKPTSGDVEHEPVLLHHSGEDRIVYATETGEVRAIEPEKGKTIWTYYTPDFSGWKPSDNRMIFKVKSFFSNTSSFFTRPIKKDLNKDGTEDLIYQSRTGDLYAINGSNGKLLWKNDKFYFESLLKGPQKDHFVYMIMEENNSVIYVHRKEWAAFPFPRNRRFSIVAVLTDGTIARIGYETLQPILKPGQTAIRLVSERKSAGDFTGLMGQMAKR
jgi:hypothetical protein